MVLKTQTHAIISNTSCTEFCSCNYENTIKRAQKSCKNMFEVTPKLFKYCFLVLSSSVPFLLVSEHKSVAHSNLKICLSNDNLDLSMVISIEQFLPCSSFYPSSLQEGSSLGQASKEQYNIAQQLEVSVLQSICSNNLILLSLHAQSGCHLVCQQSVKLTKEWGDISVERHFGKMLKCSVLLEHAVI